MKITNLSSLLECLEMFDGRVPLHLHYSWRTNCLTISNCTMDATFEVVIDLDFELFLPDLITILTDTVWSLDSCSKIRSH